MGISKKNKRTFIFQNQTFYWWIREKFDGNGGMLEINIATEDKTFLVRYYAIQKQPDARHITVIGTSFPGLEQKHGNWLRFACPDFIPDLNSNGIRPKNINSILEWCYNTKKDLISVNHRDQRVKQP